MPKRAPQIRAWLSHPVIDGDGHWMEPIPVFLVYLTELRRYIEGYGGARLKAKADALIGSLDAFRPECSVEELSKPEHVTDDFEASGVTSKADIRGVFSRNFFYGCEADDRATMWAFDPRMGVRLRPVFSSDFTHFDVPDFEDVIPEAFEMVERNYVTGQDFREFTFTNAALLHTGNNPDFFKGTVVEKVVADELGLKASTAV